MDKIKSLQRPGAACSDGGDPGGHSGAATTLCTVLLLRASLQACIIQLMRTLPREAMATHTRHTDAAVWWAAAAVLDLPPGVGEYGADMEGPDKVCSKLGRQMMLPLRHGWIGLHMPSDEVSDAAFVAGAGQAELNLKGRPAALCPLQGDGGASVRERWRSLHARYTKQCKWDAGAQDLPTEFLDSKNGLLGAQQLVRRKGDDACHADMLSSFYVDTTQGQRDAARLRSSFGGPAGAFLTAILGGRITLCNGIFVVYVWHRLGHHVPADVAPPRRANAEQELLPKQIMRWSART